MSRRLVKEKMKRTVILSIMFLSLVFSTAAAESVFADQPAGDNKDASALSGKVIETMDSGRYTYVCLEKDNKKIWVATYKMKVVVGQNMSFKPGIEMVNFVSKTLKRKFDKIYFTAGPISTKK
jgi:hypothetical protein